MEDFFSPQNSSQPSQNPPIPPKTDTPQPNLSTGNIPLSNMPPPSAPKPEMGAASSNITFSTPVNTVIPPRQNPSINAPKKDLNQMTGGKAPDKGMQKKIVLIAIGAVIAILIIAGGVWFYIQKYGTVPVTITMNQAAVDITIDGNVSQSANSPLVVNLSRSSHIISASKAGFTTIEKTIDASKTRSVAFEITELPSAKRIIEADGYFPVYNKDANKLLFFQRVAEDNYSLKEYAINEAQLGSVLDGFNTVMRTSWSPSFKQVAVKSINSSARNYPLPHVANLPDGTIMNWVIDLEKRDLVNFSIKPLAVGIKNIAFSNQGNKIADYYEDITNRSIQVANTDGSDYGMIAKVEQGFTPDVVWSPDGKRLAIFASTAMEDASKADTINIYAYDFTIRNKLQLTNDGVSTGTIFSPDGNKIAFQSSNQISIYDFDLPDSKNRLDSGIIANLNNTAWTSNSSLLVLSEKTITILKNDGSKQILSINESSVPLGTRSVVVGNGTVYLFAPDGVYELKLPEGV